jgi:hypothetical protein
MYYNMAITPWMNLTSDLQIVDSALNKAISPTRETHRHRHRRRGWGSHSRTVLVGGQQNSVAAPTTQSMSYK